MNFYPRPPRGGRPSGNGAPEICVQFLSTPSARRATYDVWEKITPIIFLSTPSARRATQAVFLPHAPTRNFYPRPPRGGRREQRFYMRMRFDFYPRPPRGGRPGSFRFMEILRHISIHALREEGDPRVPRDAGRFVEYFYPRPPRGGRRFKRRQDVKLTIFLSTPSARRATPRFLHRAR